jgi:hypothetical protein
VAGGSDSILMAFHLPALRSLGELADRAPVIVVDTREQEPLVLSVRDCFERRLPPPIGAGRLKVRDRLRQMLKEDQERESAQRQHRLL